MIALRRGDPNRLGFALQLCAARFLGTFLADPTDAPPGAVAYVARQLGVKHPVRLVHYKERPATHRERAGEIRRVYGYRDFTDPRVQFRFLRWLCARAWISAERPSVLFDLSTVWLVERKILLPGVSALSRRVAQVRDRAALRLWRRLARSPDATQRQRLEALLVVPEEARRTPLDRLRRGPTRVSAPALVGALRRLQEIRDLGVGRLDLRRIPPGRLKALARFVAAAWAPTIARMPDDRRIASPLAFARYFESVALDDSLDPLDAIVADLSSQAERDGQKGRLRTLGDLDVAALRMSEACDVALDDACDLNQLRSAIFARIPQDQLRQAVSAVRTLTRPPDDHFYPELTERYLKARRFPPTLLKTVAFHGVQASQPTLQALRFLASLEGRRRPDMSSAPMEAIPSGWKRLIVTNGQPTERRAYALRALQRLRDALRRRDIFVPGSERWGDPRAKLLRGAAWEAARPQICRTLGRQADPRAEIEALSQRLDEAYRRTAENLPRNAAVRIETRSGRDAFTLSGLDKLDEPPSLLRLRDQVGALSPRLDLPEPLMEIQLRTGFADEFTHISEAGPRVEDLAVSVRAALLAEACNVGLEPLIRRDAPALTRDRLTWIQQNYLRAETLARANARLVEAQTRIPLVRAWGGGEVASADGLRFVVPVRTVNAGPNSKYFGAAQGITYYNFTSNQFTGFHGIIIPGTTHEAPYLLEGLLEQRTSLRPIEVMADTAAYSDLIFGLFWLLGYQFSPRLADIGEARFWRIDRDADYGPLNGLARHRVNLRRIRENWDDLLRVAGSLKLGTISASELIRSLLRSGRPSTLARALGELGRIHKTLYMLPYIDDETYRRRALTQLNRHEKRHSLAREAFHGRRGEVRRRYREGQEDQLGALGLVVNAIVLWNTLYMDAALNHLRAQGAEVKSEDVARLWPLGWEHINFLGRYSFVLIEPVLRGDLRPLSTLEKGWSP